MKRYIILILLIIPLVMVAHENHVTIEIDTTIKYQIIKGWECTGWMGETILPHYPYYHDEMLGMLVNEIGMNRVRLEVRSGSENSFDFYKKFSESGNADSLYPEWRANRYATVNDNEDPDEINWDGFHFTELNETINEIIIPMKELVENNGEELYINLCYVAFITQIDQGDWEGKYIHHESDEYAEFILATLLYMESEFGFVPDGLEILLEPNNSPGWNGQVLGDCIVAVVEKLAEFDFYPDIIGPSGSTTNSSVVFFNQMVENEKAIEYLDEYSYHRYGNRLKDIDTIAARANRYGLETSMLEWWFGNATHSVLYEDLTRGMNSSWQSSGIMGMFEVDTSNGYDKPKVTIADEAEYLRMFFKWVRKGAVRVEAFSDELEHKPLAFINKNGAMTVVVKAEEEGDYEVYGLLPDTYGVTYTTKTEQHVYLYDVEVKSDDVFKKIIPSEGVITIHGRGNETEVKETKKSDIVIQPNPVREYIEIRTNNVETGLRLVSEVNEIFDILGRKHTTKNLTPALPVPIISESLRKVVIRLDVSNLQPGIYFVKVSDEFLKFVKM